MNRIGEHFHGWIYAVFALVTLCVFFACICLGSVSIPLKDTARVIFDAVRGVPSEEAQSLARSVIVPVRLPRVLNVELRVFRCLSC